MNIENINPQKVTMHHLVNLYLGLVPYWRYIVMQRVPETVKQYLSEKIKQIQELRMPPEIEEDYVVIG